ncbi:MAG: hypothetical protein CML23_00010 [Rhizobiaceae bacterium]|nr:hypothetical protein [Rhizobiaceae bacterium]|tara:strand:+ start:1220 stop:1639 length:420 start_codon:yes stop_codon:yes gene_type:complete
MPLITNLLKSAPIKFTGVLGGILVFGFSLPEASAKEPIFTSGVYLPAEMMKYCDGTDPFMIDSSIVFSAERRTIGITDGTCEFTQVRTIGSGVSQVLEIKTICREPTEEYDDKWVITTDGDGKIVDVDGSAYRLCQTLK